MRRYWVESDDLWSASEAGLVWRGRPDGHPVVFAAAIPDTDDAVVLLDVEAGPRTPLGDVMTWRHLLRVRPDGTVVWRVAPDSRAGEKDSWVAVEMTDGALVASTWSCYRHTLDPNTGRVLSSSFTK